MRYLDPLFCLYSLIIKALSNIYIPRAFRRSLYRTFGSLFLGMDDNDIKECLPDLQGFNSIGEFFSRPLRPGLRPVGDGKLIFPCDGTILESGRVLAGTIVSVKGTTYSVHELLEHEVPLSILNNLNHVNIYLSPRNYHRFHIPCAGKIMYIQHIPGCCLPVNKLGRCEKKLYALNERVIVQISNPEFVVYLAIVGAAAVRGIKIFKAVGDTVSKGDLLGMFELGSSIVVLTDIDVGAVTADHSIIACSNM